MAQQDFYEILGVSKQAGDAEIKQAFRKLAMQYHPDRNSGDAKAEQKFKEINEAYDVLKDKEKRAAYDQFGHAAFDGTAGQGQAALVVLVRAVLPIFLRKCSVISEAVDVAVTVLVGVTILDTT